MRVFRRSLSASLCTVGLVVAGVVAPVVVAAEPAGAALCVSPTYSYDSPASSTLDQWGLTQIAAPAAWATGARGAGVTVAVIDTGVDLNHPDLAAKLVPGIDLVANDACAQDEQGHGTHVAGIAAAIDNGVGTTGAAPDASIMPVRVLDAEGSGTSEVIVAGIRWAADHGAKVLNLSLGEGTGVGQLTALNQDIEAAVDYAWSKGALVVAAAGNESFPLCSYPSFAKRALCVGATDKRWLPSYFSNFPLNPSTHGVRAPGGFGDVFCESDEDIWSSEWPGSGYECEGGVKGYETLAGTSMATPFVSGVAALLFGKGLTNQQVLTCLEKTAKKPYGLNGGFDPVYGYGIVNAGAAVKAC